jgi:hypothetical protein
MAEVASDPLRPCKPRRGRLRIPALEAQPNKDRLAPDPPPYGIGRRASAAQPRRVAGLD